MKIRDDHFYHGAALTQIAEHPKFTAINGFRIRRTLSRSAFKVNDDIGIYLKYASEPNKSFNEYLFNFHEDHLKELEILKKRTGRTFLVLICANLREVCCIEYKLFYKIIYERKKKAGYQDQYGILVTAKRKQKFRVYTNAPGKKKKSLTQHKISRSDFPRILFE